MKPLIKKGKNKKPNMWHLNNSTFCKSIKVKLYYLVRTHKELMFTEYAQSQGLAKHIFCK